MENLFLNSEYDGPVNLGLRFVALVAIILLVLWLTFFLMSKLSRRPKPIGREARLRLGFLWAIIATFVILCTYWCVLIMNIEQDRIVLDQVDFYLGLGAPIATLLLLIALFLFSVVRIRKAIKVTHQQ